MLDNYDLYLKNFSQIRLLKLQNDEVNTNSKLYVLNTSVFWEINYFGKKFYDEHFKDDNT